MKVFSTLADDNLIRLIKSGAVGVLPTDTVYGLVALATNEQATKRLYELKQSDKKPGTLIAASIDQLVDLGVKARYLKAVEQYWPNPISVVIPLGTVLPYLHQGLYSIAIRIPSEPAIIALLEQTGPLITTSANHTGEPPASTMQSAQKYFGDTVDFYVDGGDISNRQASTIIRIVDDAVEVLRKGSIMIDEETGRIMS
ncbi:threonylcarbamoyl-AMP synthase [Candidatus Saccharibacteria bacterium]|nr:threonylcarbamoyl-AMP synthase [Candidatus Saccharibacteria bacterium]